MRALRFLLPVELRRANHGSEHQRAGFYGRSAAAPPGTSQS